MPALYSWDPAAHAAGVEWRSCVPKVLLVDDNPDLLATAERFLSQRGFAVVTSDTSLGVSSIVRSERPDVVVLDAMMPSVGGAALASFLKNLEAMKGVPILLYSAMDEEKLHGLARQHGLPYVSKADGLPTLHDAINAQLAR
jgi:DNA-binding response OmpR family regulator